MVLAAINCHHLVNDISDAAFRSVRKTLLLAMFPLYLTDLRKKSYIILLHNQRAWDLIKFTNGK